jgi:diacylglycerol O-acyltransferase-1
MNMLRFMERLLRLSVPNTAVWLAMFYLVFHLWLNILGELLMFGDRMFYKVRVPVASGTDELL